MDLPLLNTRLIHVWSDGGGGDGGNGYGDVDAGGVVECRWVQREYEQ